MDIKKEPDDDSLSCNEWQNGNRDGNPQNDTIGILNNPNEDFSTGLSDRVSVKKEQLFDHDDNRVAEEVVSVIFEDAYTEEKAKNLKFEPLADPLKKENNASVCSYDWNQCEQTEIPSSRMSSMENFSIPCADIEEFDIKRGILIYQPIVVDIKLNRTVIYDRNFVCSGCYHIFSSLHLLCKHRNSQSDKTSKCSQFENRSIQRSQLKLPKRIRSNKKPFQCDECQRAFGTNCDLLRHKLIHAGEKPFKCNQCNYECRCKSNLKIHQRTHSVEKPFKCDQCHYTCVSRHGMTIHERKHSGEKPFKCSQCQYETVRKACLKLHERNHSGEKPFKCDNCDYMCSSKTYMKMHKMTHSGEKPFKCDQCQFACVVKASMIRHKILHTGKKLYECNQCQYTCVSDSYLARHQMIHLAQKPLKCDHCEYRCLRKYFLVKHQLKHSGEIPSNDQNQNQIIKIEFQSD